MNRLSKITIIFILFSIASQSQALNTNEPWPVGLSTVEVYGTMAAKKGYFGYGSLGNVWYGINDYANPGLGYFVAFPGADWATGLSNLSTVYKGPVEIDLIPGIWFISHGRGLLANLKSEVTFPLDKTTPYLVLEAGKYLRRGHYTAANLGVAHYFYEKGRSFLQFNWVGMNFGAAIGHNYTFSKAWMLLLNAGIHVDKLVTGSVGFVWTIE